MNRFAPKLAFAVLFVATSACALDARSAAVENSVNPSVPSRDENASVSNLDSTVFFAGEDVPWEEFEFRHVPDPAELDIPFRSGKYAMIALECAGFATDGHLVDCGITVAPKGAGYEEVAQKLAKELVADAAFVESLNHPIKFVGIQARIANSDTPARSGPCWPPHCSSYGHPAPPPPPLIDPELNESLIAWKEAWEQANETAESRFANAMNADTVQDHGPGSPQWIVARDAAIAYSGALKELEGLLSDLLDISLNAGASADLSDLKRLDSVAAWHRSKLGIHQARLREILLDLVGSESPERVGS